MSTDARTAAAIQLGRDKATEIMGQRRAARERRAAALQARPTKLALQVRVVGAAPADAAAAPMATLETAGFLLAAGDSWFDYPFHDVLKVLHDGHGYDVESAAHRGDPIEAMAYRGGQLDAFARCIEKVVAHGAVARAVLLSGGGDDIAGDEFGMLLNSRASGIAGWNDEIVDGVVNVRIRAAYAFMLTAITDLCRDAFGRELPILVHGYDYPVPDGRGFLGGWGPLPGPWLEPGFREKLFTDLQQNVDLMRAIIDRFNDGLLAGLPAQFPHVRYVNLRGTLSTELQNDRYRDLWDNELHPSRAGFEKVAEKFAAALAAL